MPRVEEIEEETPSTNEGGTGQAPPPSDGGNGSKPSTPTGSKANQLTSELKVLKLHEKIVKLKKKLKSKKPKGQKEYSLSSNEEVNYSSSSFDESTKAKKGKGNRKHGCKPSYNTTSFNYDSLPSNHTFASVHFRKVPRFDGTHYSKWPQSERLESCMYRC
jgi:hypothetical protein